MFPSVVKVLFFDFHIFVQVNHIWAFVAFGPVKEFREEKFHRCMKLDNITDIFQKEWVYPIISQDMLVELGNDLGEVLMASNLFKEGRHQLFLAIYLLYFLAIYLLLKY